MPDELQFVDKDIAKAFEGKTYVIGNPSIIQLSREIKRLRLELQKKK